MSTLTESRLDPAAAVHREVVLAGDHWSRVITRGQVLRLVDLEGNQAADTLFYDAHDPANRYSASDTIRRQAALYLSTGTPLISTRGDVLLTIVADTCGRHDTLGGACSRESNTMRYALEKESMHACRDSFIRGAQTCGCGLGKRDITCNINFFMNVPVTPDGRLTFEDGVSGPGRYVELRAERDVLALISNCPQLNNPCNAYNPTPIEVIVWNR
ncbi:MAG TPA: urea amidolyase associated protein UAAP2 [Lacunisphaera sp.]|nr:urea amidolyase associated protein UAAP2 [Lacunisphaera sp.]